MADSKDSTQLTKPKEKFLTTGQVAERCGVNFRTVIRWIHQGYLKAYRLPGARADHRIPMEDFERFMATHRLGSLSQKVGPSKILVIDDDVLVCKALQRVLARKGYEVRVANDGFTGGMLLREFLPDLVTLDLKMKGINGLAVLKSIRESEELKSIKVIVITGDTQSKINEALGCGADLALSKPIRNQDLLSKVEQLIGKEVSDANQKSPSR